MDIFRRIWFGISMGGVDVEPLPQIEPDKSKAKKVATRRKKAIKALGSRYLGLSPAKKAAMEAKERAQLEMVERRQHAAETVIRKFGG